VAGTGVAGGAGDGGLATAAQLNSATGVAVDGLGNLFIADFNNQRIRRVDHATGIIITVAGTGKVGPAINGGPATQADLFFPDGNRGGRGGQSAHCGFAEPAGPARRCCERDRSRLWQGPERRVSTGIRILRRVFPSRPPPSSIAPLGSRWTGRGTSTSPIRATSDSQGIGHEHYHGGGDRRGRGWRRWGLRPSRRLKLLREWWSTVSGTSSSLTSATTASGM